MPIRVHIKYIKNTPQVSSMNCCPPDVCVVCSHQDLHPPVNQGEQGSVIAVGLVAADNRWGVVWDKAHLAPLWIEGVEAHIGPLEQWLEGGAWNTVPPELILGRAEVRRREGHLL